MNHYPASVKINLHTYKDYSDKLYNYLWKKGREKGRDWTEI